MAEDLRKIPSKVNLELFDVAAFSKDKIRDLFRGGKVPTADAMVEEIILRAVKQGATEIHIEPKEGELRVRLGFEGTLKRLVSLPKDIAENVANIIKTKANLNQFERKKPQEGRYVYAVGAQQFDVRVNTLPTISGERMALRISSKTAGVSKLDELGLTSENLEKIRRLLHKPSGLILLTGSSGSGISTMMRACINDVESPTKNIFTIESSIDSNWDFATQVQVSSDKSFPLNEALRPVLRQSPNIIMISEVRDIETGMVAAEAVLAGNLVLSTILASDSIGAIPRVLNFGIAPFWIATSLAGIVCQKLIRKICDSCKEEYQPTTEELALLGATQFPTFFKGKGCDVCGGTGYRERTGIHEVLVIDDKIRDLIYRQASFLELKEAANSSGFQDLRTDAVKKSIVGITTPEEVIRAVG